MIKTTLKLFLSANLMVVLPYIANKFVAQFIINNILPDEHGLINAFHALTAYGITFFVLQLLTALMLARTLFREQK